MATIFEIDEAILSCVDTETGEILNEEMLNALVMVREQKIENVALWVKNLTIEAEALKKEKKTFEEREKVAKNKIEGLKKWLAFACNGKKFTTTKCAISFRNTESVEQVEGTEIPKEFQRVTTTIEPDKNEIKKALKSGQEVKGFYLKANKSVTIK